MPERPQRHPGGAAGIRPGCPGHRPAGPAMPAAPRYAEVDQLDHEQMRARASAMLPDELLQSGEIIILLLKPSILFVVLSGLGALVALAALMAGALLLAEAGLRMLPRLDIALAGVGLITLRLGWGFLEWLSRVYVLTDRRVIRVRGVLRISVFEAPLRCIQHTLTMFGVLERLAGLGSIGFTTAGTHTIEATWEMLPRPLEVHRVVVRTLQRYR